MSMTPPRARGPTGPGHDLAATLHRERLDHGWIGAQVGSGRPSHPEVQRTLLGVWIRPQRGRESRHDDRVGLPGRHVDSGHRRRTGVAPDW